MAPRFADELSALLAAEGTTVPEGFGDTLTTAYNDDISESAGELNTVIGLRDERIRELMANAAIETIPDDAAESYDDDDELDADFGDFFTENDDSGDK